MPFPEELSSLGKILMRLGEDPAMYQRTPPMRAKRLPPLEQLTEEPGLGLGRVNTDVAPPGYFQNEGRTVSYTSDHENGHFVKMHHDGPLFRRYWRDLYDSRPRLPQADGFTEIESSGGAGPLGGTAEYLRNWTDDHAAGELNVPTILTPINKHRRPINALQFQLRQPEAPTVLPYQQGLFLDETTSFITPEDWVAMEPEDRLGALVSENLYNMRRTVPATQLKRLEGQDEDGLLSNAAEVAKELRAIDPDGPLGAYGRQTLIRNELLRRLLLEPENDDIQQRLIRAKVFKRRGGRV